MEGTKYIREKPNTVFNFTVLFWDDWVQIGDHRLPVGQVTTDILDLDDDVLLRTREEINSAADIVLSRLLNPDIKKDLALVREVQDKLIEANNMILNLPLYKDLCILSEHGFLRLAQIYQDDPDDFCRNCAPGSQGESVFKEILLCFAIIVDEMIGFITHVRIMLDFYFENLGKRNPEYYAVGIYSFFTASEVIAEIREVLPPTPMFDFRQTRPVMVEYTTMPNPEKPQQYVIAERMEFESAASFLHMDFFRGLMRGNAPRRCHNCGRYFLLTSGYDLCYCNRIAPGETAKTCRKVGAHRKAATKEKAPFQKEYEKVYNRLKTRKARGKISVDEWNQAVAHILQLKDQAESGELSEFDLKKLYEQV